MQIAVFSQCLSSSSLTTFYAQNNGQAGQQFDVNALQDVEICAMDVNMYTGTNQYQIYTKAGTHVGFEMNAAAWTLIGGPVAITSNGTDMATPVPIPINLTIMAGNTGAIYFTCNRTLTPGGGNRYTNGTAVGNLLASNADIEILEGTGKAWSFGSNYKPRQFNGTLYYDVISVLPVELMSFSGESLGEANRLEWSTSSEINAESYIVQRSVDGTQYENIASLSAAGTTTERQDYSYIDETPRRGINYYRLKQIDVDGEKDYSEVIAVSKELIKEFAISSVYPNPTNGELTIELYTENESSLSIQITDIAGNPVLNEELTPRKGVSKIQVDVSNIAAGMYNISLKNDRKILQSTRFIKN